MAEQGRLYVGKETRYGVITSIKRLASGIYDVETDKCPVPMLVFDKEDKEPADSETQLTD